MVELPSSTSPAYTLEADSVTDENLSERLRSIPRLPGVYLMKDVEAKVIYVGKAKDLRARVRTYFAGGDGRAQIEYLIKRVRKIDTIVTESENQAFVLERDLITKYKPRYNIRLKDDKAFLSIRIDTHAEWPKLELVRRVDDDGALYFGPYSFSYELRNLLEIVKRVVPLRTCTNTVFYNRQRPCLEYQIKRCAGPCVLPVDRDQYAGWVKQAIAILEGRTEWLVKDLTRQMNQASEDLRFEDAALFRDRLNTLAGVREAQVIGSHHGEDRDIFALYREERLAVLTVLRMRRGRVAETNNFSFSEVAIDDEALVESAVEQFYASGRDIPEEVVLPVEIPGGTILEEVLSERRGKVVHFQVPQRGIRYRMLSLAQLNARQHYIASFDAEARNVELAKELARTLGLKQVPRRIECVDISNFQGSDIVGAVVVFFDGAPDKKLYKRYRLSFQHKPDDFAAIHEVVRRRLQRGLAEGDLPDLLIIDGGPQQLAKALQARDELRLSLEIVSIAKMRAEREGRSAKRGTFVVSKRKPERIYIEGQDEPLVMDESKPVTHLVQRIRDEVHRYVITFHRQTRARRVLLSVLDGVPGVGPERKRRLLKRYGSVERLRSLTPEDLSAVGKMPLGVAERLLAVLAQQREAPQVDDDS